jgi:hypothetical protein
LSWWVQYGRPVLIDRFVRWWIRVIKLGEFVAVVEKKLACQGINFQFTADGLRSTSFSAMLLTWCISMAENDPPTPTTRSYQ